MDLRYPLGRLTLDPEPTAEKRAQWIATIAATPAALRAAVAGLGPAELDTPYRPEGWTVRQLVHHLPDSHLNAYVRLKLALTEETPTIKPYDEARWAELADSRETPIEVSLTLLEALHERWVRLLAAMAPADFRRAWRHPELGERTVDELLQIYAWHGPHHVAHITALRQRQGWS